MTTRPTVNSPTHQRLAHNPHAVRWLAVLGVATAWCLFSFVQAPVPGVNEPHYLAKARHYWLPDWCRADFFLQSSNPHLVFYQTVGLLTKFLTLPMAAVAGRLIGYGLLALGWTLALSKIVRAEFDQATITGHACNSSARHWLIPLTAACLFMVPAATVTLSGEWVLGGIESKVLAYACLLLAIAGVIANRHRTAGILLGLSIAFHPVVGAWSSLSVICGVLWRDRRHLSDWFSWSGWCSQTLPVLGWLVVCSLPGLLPALQVVHDPDLTNAQRLDADYIQVFHRVAHHLDPQVFPLSRYAAYGCMFCSWLLLEQFRPVTAARSFWRAAVVTSVIVAGLGVLAGYGPRPAVEMPGLAWRTLVLKLYPFRLADALVPMALSLSLAELLWMKLTRWLGPGRGLRVATAVSLIAVATGVLYPADSRNPSRLSPQALADWITVSEWVQRESSPDTLVHTPRDGWGFKWYSERAEYFSPKDCPQEARGLLEWFRRARMVRDWELKSRADGGYNRTALQAVHGETRADLMITFSDLELPCRPLFETETFVVIDLSEFTVEQQSEPARVEPSD